MVLIVVGDVDPEETIELVRNMKQQELSEIPYRTSTI